MATNGYTLENADRLNLKVAVLDSAKAIAPLRQESCPTGSSSVQGWRLGPQVGAPRQVQPGIVRNIKNVVSRGQDCDLSPDHTTLRVLSDYFRHL